MIKKQEALRITLLVHSRIAIFEWGKSVIDLFTAQAIKNKYTLTLVYDAEEITAPDTPVVIIGVDSEWLHLTLDKLNLQRNKIILIHGIAHKDYEYVSHISADQRVTVQKSLNLLKEKKRTRTAFFGVQKNDSSDITKALAFSECFPSEDVYHVENSVEECFERLHKELERYDSIICSNDVMAIYLIARFRALGINVPERLYLIGNGNLWLSSHVTPTLTTVSYNPEVTARLALQMCENLHDFENIGSINMSVSAQLIERGSTEKAIGYQSFDSQASHKRGAYIEYGSEAVYRELSEIVSLDRVLSTCSEDQLYVLRAWIAGDSVECIAEKMFISPDTVKYHLKTLYKLLDIHSKNELTELANNYGLTL